MIRPSLFVKNPAVEFLALRGVIHSCRLRIPENCTAVAVQLMRSVGGHLPNPPCALRPSEQHALASMLSRIAAALKLSVAANVLGAITSRAVRAALALISERRWTHAKAQEPASDEATKAKAKAATNLYAIFCL